MKRTVLSGQVLAGSVCANTGACASSPAVFSVAALSNDAPVFAWQVITPDGEVADLKDGPIPGSGSLASGVATGTLTISQPDNAAAAMQFRCIIMNRCGSVTSTPASFSFCIADFNCDGGVDGTDVEAFFLTWESGASNGDVNADGGVDGADIEFFFTRWEAGC